jgi:hypothetical protein
MAPAPPRHACPARSASSPARQPRPARGCSRLRVKGRPTAFGVITPYRIDIVQGNVVTKEQAALIRPGLTRAAGARRARHAAARRPLPRRPLGLPLHAPPPRHRAAAPQRGGALSKATPEAPSRPPTCRPSASSCLDQPPRQASRNPVKLELTEASARRCRRRAAKRPPARPRPSRRPGAQLPAARTRLTAAARIAIAGAVRPHGPHADRGRARRPDCSWPARSTQPGSPALGQDAGAFLGRLTGVAITAT